VQALLRTSTTHELCRVVGAVERGTRGEGHDAWARTGREMNAIWERAHGMRGNKSCRE
jgi:hypothetical protein